MNASNPSTSQAQAQEGSVTQVDDSADSGSVDLTNRPDGAWLDSVTSDVADVEVVLKCLARDNATMCTTCHGLSELGELEQRSVLARCASTKEQR